MNDSSAKYESSSDSMSLLLYIILSIVLSFVFPILMVLYEGLVWGGEGLFSFMLVSPLFGTALIVLGIGLSFFVHKAKDQTIRAKRTKTSRIIYIGFVITVFISMSFVFYDSLGPLTSR